MGEWPEPREVLIANNGNMYALISGLFSYTSHILAISKKGELLWSKKLEGVSASDIDITANGEYICLSSRNKLFLFDGNGKKIWNYSFGKEFEYSFEKISISNDASLIVTYEMNNKKIYTFDSKGEGKWGFNCSGFNGFSLNKEYKYLAVLKKVEDEIPTIFSDLEYRTLSILNSQGQVLINSCGLISDSWYEFSVSANRQVSIVVRKASGRYFLSYYEPVNSTDYKIYSKATWEYMFEPPSGFHKKFSPEEKISNDGNTIIFSDGFEIYCFKKEQLEKRW